ncbi:hypothetical protein DXA14_33580, partial [Hungatella hathewayi]
HYSWENLEKQSGRKVIRINVTCNTCRYRNRCIEQSRRYPCKDYKRRDNSCKKNSSSEYGYRSRSA